MTRVTIGSREYLLRFDMRALEGVEDAFEGIDGLFNAMQGKHRTRSIRTIFRILANSGEISQGREATITGEEVFGLTMPEMTKLMDDIRSEIEGARKTRVKDPEEEAARAAAIAGGGMIVDANSLPGENEKNANTGIS